MPGATQQFLAQLISQDEETLAVAEELTFQRGQFVYQAGETPKGIYLVKAGLVGLTIAGPSGKQHLMRFFKAGQVFGHRSILAEQAFHASTQVLENTRLAFIPKAYISQLFERHPNVYHGIVRQLALELHNCEIQQVNVLDQQVLPRIAQAIVYLKELHPDYRWTRSELASFCASTTSTVIKALAELEYLGLLKQRGREIQILDREGLIQLQFHSDFE